jgi:hypothetical protein
LVNLGNLVYTGKFGKLQQKAANMWNLGKRQQISPNVGNWGEM